MKRLRHFLWVGATSAAFAADSPTLIPFQAQLTNQQNELYGTGTYTITFNLYDQAVGGASLWTERHQQVGVISGSVNLFLGSIEELPPEQFTKTLYLGITIDADGNSNTPDPEMVPRQMIIPAFHSKNAEKLAGHDWSTILVGNSNDPSNAKIRGAAIEPEDVTAVQIRDGEVKAAEIATGAVGAEEIADGSVTESELSAALNARLNLGLIPPGTIVPFAGPEANLPAGWLACDGSALQAADYPSLFAAISTSWGNGTQAGTGALHPAIPSGVDQTDFNLPDLRGYFLRGNDSGSGRDPDRAARAASLAGGNTGQTANWVGSIQSDAFQGHRHDVAVDLTTNTQQGSLGQALDNNTGISNIEIVRSASTDPGFGTARVASETRSKNAYINYIIKY